MGSCRCCGTFPATLRVEFPYTGRAYEVCDPCGSRAADLDGVSIVALAARP